MIGDMILFLHDLNDVLVFHNMRQSYSLRAVLRARSLQGRKTGKNFCKLFIASVQGHLTSEGLQTYPDKCVLKLAC